MFAPEIIANMESQVSTQKDPNVKYYWFITLASLVVCIALIAFAPEWFWLTLPFLLTFFVKAIGMM